MGRAPSMLTQHSSMAFPICTHHTTNTSFSCACTGQQNCWVSLHIHMYVYMCVPPTRSLRRKERQSAVSYFSFQSSSQTQQADNEPTMTWQWQQLSFLPAWTGGFFHNNNRQQQMQFNQLQQLPPFGLSSWKGRVQHPGLCLGSATWLAAGLLYVTFIIFSKTLSPNHL